MKIKNIHFAFLIIVLLLGGGLLYLRGGGGDPDFRGDLIYGIVLPAKPKPAAIPDVCTVDQAINPLQDQTSKYLSTACIVEFPDSLKVVPYCVNKTAKLGAANITLPQGTSQFLNIPKNCTVLVNDEKLYAKTIVCSGPAGSTVKLTVQNSCTPPAANLPDFVDPYCPPDYQMDEAGRCLFITSPSSFLCPTSYHYEESSNCCRLDRLIYACPTGYQTSTTFISGVGTSVSCILKAKGAYTTNTRSYTITLGNCYENKQGDTDKPAPCIIDPASGTCK